MALDVNGPINYIQEDLFKSFKSLKTLRFRTQNVKRILTHQNKWIDFLNLNVSVDLNDFYSIDSHVESVFILVLFQTFSNLSFYEYPLEDFCYFKNFPHQRLVVPQLKPNFKTSCTCTELYLIQYSYFQSFRMVYYTDQLIADYYFLSQYYFDDINQKNFSNCINNSIMETIKNCNFDTRLNMCEIKSFNYSKDDKFKWYVLDWNELSRYSQTIFALYINKIFSLIGIFINILIIIILSSKIIENKIYIHLKIYSFANLIYIIVLAFGLLTSCAIENIFCSGFYDSIYAQYFDTIFVKMIKNSLKTFSDISYMSFILTRYIKITASTNSYLKRFEKLSLKNFLISTIFFSILINFYIYFEYKVDFRQLKMNTSIETQDPFDRFRTSLSHLENSILYFFQLMKIFFSDLLFFSLTILIDTSLVIFIKKTITVAPSKRSIKMKKSTKARITKMIVLNGINFIVLRFPSAVVDFYGLLFTLENKETIKLYKPNLAGYIICRVLRFCESLQEIFYFFYLFSFILQFIIFYRTDTNFKQSFKRIISLIKNYKKIDKKK